MIHLVLPLVLMAAGLFPAQEQDQPIVIRPPLTGVTNLAVVDFQARGAATPESESALKVFNEVLWKDLPIRSRAGAPGRRLRVVAHRPGIR
jgi:hypothetical protein